VKTTRRLFVVTTGCTVAGTFTGCGGGGSPSSPTAPPTPPPITGEIRVPLMGIGETVGAFANLVGGLQTPLAVTRVSQTDVVCVSRVCTHEGCTVNLPATSGSTLDCPCHGSRFRNTGQVVNGPAARSLFPFPARIQGNEVVITPNF
jgi:nitrite reductase/ring-hydroxylating ferredoxin subunit